MPSQKRRLLDELIDEVRMSQNATDRFDDAVADAIGMNRTDMRCTDVLDREGPVSAGRLAEVTGLTSGAITTAIDRLERGGIARRLADPADRRRVLVELTPQAREQGNSFYAGHAELGERLYRRYSAEQLLLLLEFVREGREFNERAAAELERENRERGRGVGESGGRSDRAAGVSR
jgi:DNA-binding MarR family transcriptional regulator